MKSFWPRALTCLMVLVSMVGCHDRAYEQRYDEAAKGRQERGSAEAPRFKWEVGESAKPHQLRSMAGTAREDAKVVAAARTKTEAAQLNVLRNAPDVPDAPPERRAGERFGATVQQPANEPNTESYDKIIENPFHSARENPLSTFAIDVDTASYSNVRRFLRQQQLPPRGAVRIEELINYFPYEYSPPTGELPFSVTVEIAGCPWNADHRLASIGLKGREVQHDDRPPCNLVFLIDVSGSMNEPNKLPLVKSAMSLLTRRLRENDRVAIVVYAGQAGLVLPSTSAEDRDAILTAIDQLSAGGSTNGGEGIQLAYSVASRNFVKGGVNRIILCTDGDFNVGVTDQRDLVRLIEEKAQSCVALTVLGFGMGNYKDSTMEKLADKGHGNYAYIDNLDEARKSLVEQLSGTLVTIAKDVKIQVDFNPARVAGYRLIGYEDRALRPEDFDDDMKSAGDVGAGHTVTALYEIIPAGQPVPGSDLDGSKYQEPHRLSKAAGSRELFTVHLRYKEPQGEKSKLLDVPMIDDLKPFTAASAQFRFATSVAEFGMLLRDSRFRGNTTFDGVIQTAQASLGVDPAGHRSEFLELAKLARELKR